ncbi:hypothetical protein BST92_10100 [Nonlabens arenilitoris]|uniref:Sensor of ECF-type sigma factor n=1 Tax=Nonlabens arenilitoris TaxID=1217969 RepID=A0A2S7UBF5_9FLAO|nr:hypothetical protein [Nonlabens arenilitoris]PQJ32255.1 hypothetical protein BST92_10100 [Nonlabens arenilitoris]
MAQGPEGDRDNHRRMNKEKIEALAVAYITEQLELTPDEAGKFWPVFNKLREKRHSLERKKKALIREMESKVDALTDNEASNYVSKITDLDNQIHAASYEQNSNEIIKIIGAKRFLKLMKAEMDFRKKMLREYKERRGRDRP